jgi:hypothetical protein
VDRGMRPLADGGCGGELPQAEGDQFSITQLLYVLNYLNFVGLTIVTKKKENKNKNKNKK